MTITRGKSSIFYICCEPDNDTMLIQDIMTSHPAVLFENSSVQEVLDAFKGKDYDHLPIVNADNYLTGIISKTDIYSKLLDLVKESTGMRYNEIFLQKTLISEIMTPHPVYVEQDTALGEAIKTLLEIGFHALPVCKHDKVVGIVTTKDLLKAVNQSTIM